MTRWQRLKEYYTSFGLGAVAGVIAFRLFGRPQELTVRPVELRHPVRLRPGTTDGRVFRDVVRGGEYELVEMDRSPQTIVDVGANIGITSIYFANRYPEARIIAVEPEASNYEILVRNAARYRSITPIRAAIWSRDGEVNIGLDLDATEADKWGFHVRDNGIPVRALTMRTLMREAGIGRIGLLKMDVEGDEHEIFQVSDWMECVDALAIELHEDVKPGCRAIVEAATRGFRRSERGQVTFYHRSSNDRR